MWKLQCGQWGNESTDNLFTGVSFLRLRWFVCLYFDFSLADSDQSFWLAVVNIQVSFITLNERPLYETSSAWHGMTYMMTFGYDIEISTILESLDLFFTVEVLYYGWQYCPNFSSSKVSSLNVIHGCDFTVPGCDVQSYLIQLYENLRLVRRIAYCKPGILTDWDPYPSPPSRSFESPLFQIHPSLVLGNHLKRTRKKRGKWRGKVKESDGDR